MTDRDRRRAWIAGFVIVSVIAAASLGWLVGRATRSSSEAGAVTLVPADQPGADPFTESVAADQVPDVGTISGDVGASLTTDSQTRTLVAVGTAPGLYGGSGDTHVCDAQKLVSFLARNRDKAKAWAGVFGISPSDIGSYVASLTPVVLTGDTLVTNHGYRDGVATPLQSVLQAGTAVFVDRTGVPRVKCNCGNPLAPPAPISLSSASLSGVRWAGYAPTQVRIVRAGPSQSTLTLVNVTTGTRYDEAVGTGGGAGQWVGITITDTGGSTTQTAIYTSDTGASWGQVGTITNEAIHALVWVDDHWVALARRNDETSTRVLTSSDLRSWKQIATVPDDLAAIARGDGRFVATGAHWTPPLLEGGTPHSIPVAYTSTDGQRWSKVGAQAFSNSTSQNGWSPPLAYGNGRWISMGLGEFTGDGGLAGAVLSSEDAVHWSQNGGHPTLSGNASLAFGAGTWALAGYGTGGLAASTDAKTWSPASVSGATDADAVAFGNGTFLAVSLVRGSTTVLNSSDARSWAPIGTGPLGMDVLAFGGSGTAPASSPPADTAGSTPCTRAALQDVFSHDPEDDMNYAILNSKDELHCAGGWAAIHYGNQGRYPLAVFRAVNGAWTVLPVSGIENLGEGERQTGGQYCTDPRFPAALKTAVCG